MSTDESTMNACSKSHNLNVKLVGYYQVGNHVVEGYYHYTSNWQQPKFLSCPTHRGHMLDGFVVIEIDIPADAKWDVDRTQVEAFLQKKYEERKKKGFLGPDRRKVFATSDGKTCPFCRSTEWFKFKGGRVSVRCGGQFVW